MQTFLLCHSARCSKPGLHCPNAPRPSLPERRRMATAGPLRATSLPLSLQSPQKGRPLTRGRINTRAQAVVFCSCVLIQTTGPSKSPRKGKCRAFVQSSRSRKSCVYIRAHVWTCLIARAAKQRSSLQPLVRRAATGWLPIRLFLPPGDACRRTRHPQRGPHARP